MRVHRIMLTGAAMLLSTAVGAFAGQATPKPSTQSGSSTQATGAQKSGTQKSSSHSTSMKTHEATGTIVSVSDTSLVLDQKVKGKTQQETYTLNSSTRKSGNLETGARATVRYQNENNSMVAASVTAHPAKTASNTKSKSHSTKPGTGASR